jgi:hypothetical protein
LKLTGYYRPEDAEVDLEALAAGNVKWCGNNTGNEAEDRNWGETRCRITSRTSPGAPTGSSTKTAMAPRSDATTTSGRASRTVRTTTASRTDVCNVTGHGVILEITGWR